MKKITQTLSIAICLLISLKSKALINPDDCPRLMNVTFSDIKMVPLTTSEQKNKELVHNWSMLANSQKVEHTLVLTDRNYTDNTCAYKTESGKKAFLGKKFFFQSDDRLWIEDKDAYNYGAGTSDAGAKIISMSKKAIILSSSGATYNDLGFPYYTSYKYSEPEWIGGDYFDGYLETHIGYAQTATIEIK